MRKGNKIMQSSKDEGADIRTTKERIEQALDNYFLLKQEIEKIKGSIEKAEKILSEKKDLEKLTEEEYDILFFSTVESRFKIVTHSLNFYVEKRLWIKERFDKGKYVSRTQLRDYRSSILLKEHYMEGKDLKDIDVYKKDPNYKRKSKADKELLIENLYSFSLVFELIDSEFELLSLDYTILEKINEIRK